jgi:putative hydrolase of the HAD superfamily
MIPVFDLDDTLYPEKSFVESGFRSVALALETRLGMNADVSFQKMLFTLNNEGRGLVFDQLLASNNISSRSLIKFCINTYRHHKPTIQLDGSAESILDRFDNKAYLVTDGHKIVQENKVNALRLQDKFKKIYITHRYGVRNAKPSVYCFDLIRKVEKCEWKDMFYVGDNPLKDFVNLNPMGVKTIRIKRGAHALVIANKKFEAQHVIDTLDELPFLLKEIYK